MTLPDFQQKFSLERIELASTNKVRLIQLTYKKSSIKPLNCSNCKHHACGCSLFVIVQELTHYIKRLKIYMVVGRQNI
jgi:hypothetical protein